MCEAVLRTRLPPYNQCVSPAFNFSWVTHVGYEKQTKFLQARKKLQPTCLLFVICECMCWLRRANILVPCAHKRVYYVDVLPLWFSYIFDFQVNWKATDVAVFVTSSFGVGIAPDNANEFEAMLNESRTHKSTTLPRNSINETMQCEDSNRTEISSTSVSYFISKIDQTHFAVLGMHISVVLRDGVMFYWSQVLATDVMRESLALVASAGIVVSD